MEEWMRILSPSSAPWVTWVLLGLLVLAFGNGLFVSDIFIVVRGLFSKADRVYVDRNTQSIAHNIISWSFRVGIISLVSYLWIYNEHHFTILSYLVIMGVMLGVLLLQWLLIRFVGIVFVSQKQLVIAMEQRSVSYNAIAMLLWPMALVMVHTNRITDTVLCSIAIGIFVIVMCTKYVQLFYKNVLSIVYMLLYVISLEVLPLCVALLCVKKII